MNDNLKKLFNTLSQIMPTDGERALMRANIEKSSVPFSMPLHPNILKSPYHRYLIRPFQIGATIVLVFSLTGGSGLAYASGQSLPGEILYSLKINIEEAHGYVKPTVQEKARWEITRTERRLEETVTLTKQGKLNEKAKNIIQKNIQEHTNKIKEETQKLKENEPEKALEVATELSAKISAHAEVLAEAQEIGTLNGDGPLDEIVTSTEEIAATAKTDKKDAEENFETNNQSVTRDVAESKRSGLIEKIKDFEKETSIPALHSETVPVAEKPDAPVSTPLDEKVLIPDSDALQTKMDDIRAFLDEGDAAMTQGDYAHAFISFQKAEEIIIKSQTITTAKEEIAKTEPGEKTETTLDPKPAIPEENMLPEKIQDDTIPAVPEILPEDSVNPEPIPSDAPAPAEASSETSSQEPTPSSEPATQEETKKPEESTKR